MQLPWWRRSKSCAATKLIGYQPPEKRPSAWAVSLAGLRRRRQCDSGGMITSESSGQDCIGGGGGGIALVAAVAELHRRRWDNIGIVGG